MSTSKRDWKHDEVAAGWGELLALGLRSGHNSNMEEWRACFQKTVSTPVDFHLCNMEDGQREALHRRTTSGSLSLRTWRELLINPDPPIQLLTMAKDYFKACVSYPKPGFPSDVARGLYYVTLAAAILHEHRAITTLNDEELSTAMAWVAGKNWIDDEWRQLAKEALLKLSIKPDRDPS